MANVWRCGEWTKAFVRSEELSEALKLPNELMFEVWRGVVKGGGFGGAMSHDDAIRWAWEYDGILRGEFEPDVDVDNAVLDERRAAWNAGEGAKVDEVEVEKRRCGLSDWNFEKRAV